MSETPLEQRQRLERKRMTIYTDELIKCLECSLRFTRVGSHVVQVHGYESAKEYRKNHGINWKTGKETTVQSHRDVMSKKTRENKTIKNLQNGASTRFVKGGNHRKIVSEYWKIKRESKISANK